MDGIDITLRQLVSDIESFDDIVDKVGMYTVVVEIIDDIMWAHRKNMERDFRLDEESQGDMLDAIRLYKKLNYKDRQEMVVEVLDDEVKLKINKNKGLRGQGREH